MSYFYTKNDDLINSELNRSFAELFRVSDKKFAEWVDELCISVALQWDEFGQPPKAGVPIEEMGNEFRRLCTVDTSKMWFKDERTRKFDCVIDGARVSVANSFFPNILKAQDTLAEGVAVSVYDLFANLSLRDKTLEILAKSIREDGFYEFSPIYRPPSSFNGDLRSEARRVSERILADEARGVGSMSLWLDVSPLSEQRTPRLSLSEVKGFLTRGLLSKHHLNGLDIDQVSKDTLFRLRVYSTGKLAVKVLPTVFRHIELGAGVAPNNFPASIARLMYQLGTDKLIGQKQINVYDPSMGFGGRLLGALSLRDRPIHYIGTDPNTENWIDELGISRYEYMSRVFQSHIRSGSNFDGTYLCCGSEDVAKNKEFQKYKGKLDFVFTSPPYFSAEVYSNESTQSSIKFKDYDSWRDNFLLPTLETCVQWLRSDRLLALNIADINIGTTQYPLEADTVDILRSLGMRFQSKIKMVLARSPAMKLKKQYRQPSTKNFCVINGKWRKFEPIFVFRKP